MKAFVFRWLVLLVAFAALVAAEQWWHLGPESGINTKNAIEQLRHPTEEGSQKVRTVEATKGILWVAAPLGLALVVLFVVDLRLTLNRRNRPQGCRNHDCYHH